MESRPTMPDYTLDESAKKEIDRMKKKLILNGYSHHTQKSYIQSIILFLGFFTHRNYAEIRKEEIEAFVYQLKTKYKLSDTKQNLVINAIKFYYEHV